MGEYDMRVLRFFFKMGLFMFMSFIVVIIGLYLYAYLSPKLELRTAGQYYIYDTNDELVYQGSSTSEWVSLEDINYNLINAVISVEDKNFYQHHGFDYLRIARAMYLNIKNGKITQGASTISQQYVKNIFLDFSTTWSRKIEEAFLTLELEVHYTKDEILEGYLNTINYGQGNFGIGNASRYYFNKEPIDLTLEEALILAGIPNSPENYNPVANYDLSIERAKIVGNAMVENGYLSLEEFDSLFQDKIEIYGKSSEENLDMLMYYQDAVIEELKNIKTIPEELLQSGGIKIYTYLDLDAQKNLEENILTYLTDSELQSASVVIDPNTGGVIALSGGVSYAKSQYNRATQAKRQVGSAMKPFLYYGALEEGMTSASTFNSQYTTFTLSNGNVYSPKNYGSVYANKEITMAEAIAVSDNVYAVKTNMFLGADKLVDTAKKVGIEADLSAVASLALGTGEMSVLDLARGYTTFATGGYKQDVGFIKKVEDSEGNVLYEKDDTKDLVLNMNYNYILTEMLTGTTNSHFKDYANPTALTIASKLSRKYAIKTGTTDTDFWIAGYNPDVVMVTWVGMDDNSPLSASDSYISKNIWADTVEDILIDTEEHWYETPENVVGVVLDAVSGVPTNDVSKATLFYFVKGTEDMINTEYVSKEEELKE
ncbi:penicillin-binding protein 1A family [Mycoplasma sp. CAG:776]|nr:penicillin-binding protein 1A family [Mycoplasma sp. CAG:776]